MTEITLRVADFETSGLAPPEAEIVEIGYVDMVFDTETKVSTIGAPQSVLYRPERGMPPEISAIHHLTMKHLREHPVCQELDLKLLVTEGAPRFLVAHNWSFEGQWLTPEILGDVRPICTLKAAARVWPEAPSMGNSALRYWLDLDLDEDLASPPHRAGPDAYVTANILARLLATETVRDLVLWTQMPRHYSKMPIGKHKGQAWGEVPADYLLWVQRQPDMDADIKAAASDELQRRKA